jgi:hypothetical protein
MFFFKLGKMMKNWGVSPATLGIPTLLKMKFEGGSRTEISFQNSVACIYFSQ